MSPSESSKLIDDLGGTCVVAAECDRTPGAVSQWRKNGMPDPWVRYFRARRPDLFDVSGRKPDQRQQEAA